MQSVRPMSFIRSKDVVAKLFDVIQLQFVDRNGGYTRIIQTGVRQGDAAAMAILELVGYQEVVESNLIINSLFENTFFLSRLLRACVEDTFGILLFSICASCMDCHSN